MEFERISPVDQFKENLRTGILTVERSQLMANLGHPIATQLYPRIEVLDSRDNLLRKEFIPRFTENEINTFLLLMAKKVLPFYEEVNPKDKRVSRLIQYTSWYVNNENEIDHHKLLRVVTEAQSCNISNYNYNRVTGLAEGYDRITIRSVNSACACAINVAGAICPEVRDYLNRASRSTGGFFTDYHRPHYVNLSIKQAFDCTPEVSATWIKENMLKIIT